MKTYNRSNGIITMMIVTMIISSILAISGCKTTPERTGAFEFTSDTYEVDGVSYPAEVGTLVVPVSLKTGMILPLGKLKSLSSEYSQQVKTWQNLYSFSPAVLETPISGNIRRYGSLNITISSWSVTGESTVLFPWILRNMWKYVETW
jgi:hypothetical protein